MCIYIYISNYILNFVECLVKYISLNCNHFATIFYAGHSIGNLLSTIPIHIYLHSINLLNGLQEDEGKAAVNGSSSLTYYRWRRVDRNKIC